MQETEDLDRDVQDEEVKPLSRKKLLVFVLPAVIVIGLSAGIFFVFFQSGFYQLIGIHVELVPQLS